MGEKGKMAKTGLFVFLTLILLAGGLVPLTASQAAADDLLLGESVPQRPVPGYSMSPTR